MLCAEKKILVLYCKAPQVLALPPTLQALQTAGLTPLMAVLAAILERMPALLQR